MRVLILGGSGMLGHRLWRVFVNRFDTYVTLRQGTESYTKCGFFEPKHLIGHVSVQDFDSVVQAVARIKPDVLVNCIGIVKQAAAAKEPFMSILVNALFPHQLAKLSQEAGIRLIHISTDCVFSGRKGNYSENDLSDAEDLYGRTKFLGEVSYKGCFTLRTSMIGRELETSHGLIEWFLSQEGKTVGGYTRAIFSGLTTNALAEIIARIVDEQREMYGVWHVASEPISKFELLNMVKLIYGLNIKIKPDETVIVDRSLNAERFQKATDIISPSWHDMIEQMYRDTTPYVQIRRSNANR